jgi:DNA adenine methylase
MLRRLGNKKRVLSQLLQVFPEKITHFIDLFLGSGAVTFAMVDRKIPHIWANDSENDIYNLFCVLREQPDQLMESIELAPYHQTLWDYWKSHEEPDPLWQAVRFLMRSNYGLWGKNETLHYTDSHNKQMLLQQIPQVLQKVQDVQFLCCDFRDVLKRIHFCEDRTAATTFVYADPPYLETTSNYSRDFSFADTQELFEILCQSGFQFGISERDSPIIQDLANSYHLHYHVIAEQRALKNRQTEVYLCNYEIHPPQLFLFSEGVS